MKLAVLYNRNIDVMALIIYRFLKRLVPSHHYINRCIGRKMHLNYYVACAMDRDRKIQLLISISCFINTAYNLYIEQK